MEKQKLNRYAGWVLLIIFAGFLVWERGLMQILAVIGIIGVSMMLLSLKDSVKKKNNKK